MKTLILFKMLLHNKTQIMQANSTFCICTRQIKFSDVQNYLLFHLRKKLMDFAKNIYFMEA